jgi:hypothetical protein
MIVVPAIIVFSFRALYRKILSSIGLFQQGHAARTVAARQYRTRRFSPAGAKVVLHQYAFDSVHGYETDPRFTEVA